MHNADTQCTVGGERGPKGREIFSCLNFSCLAIKREFYFTLLILVLLLWGRFPYVGSQNQRPILGLWICRRK